MNLDDLNNSEFMKEEPVGQKSGGELLAEIGRLLLKLIWAIFRKAIRVIAKGLIAFLLGTKACCDAINVWWHDRSTQEKVRFLRIKLRAFARKSYRLALVMLSRGAELTRICLKLLVKYSIAGSIAFWHGCIWLAVNTVQAIVHMKPTMVRLWNWLKKVFFATVALYGLFKRGRKLSAIRRRRRYETFKRNGGVKGAMQRTSNSMKIAIQQYMEEEQEDVSPEAVTEDDLFVEEMEQNEKLNNAQIIGKRFFEGMKKVVE